MKTYTLHNGVVIPAIGFGTAALPIDNIPTIISTAYDAGYRMFDTAWHYYNEELIGNSLLKLGIPREKLFLTNKLHEDNLYFGWKLRRFNIPKQSVRMAFEASCKKLHTEYLDLYLIHWPFKNFEHLWEEIIKIYETGRIKAIGVCSFEPEHLDYLERHSGIIPMVNQFEISPYCTRKNLIEYCRRKNIQIEAFSAFGVGRNKNVVPEMISNPVIKDIASANNKTSAQVILRWLVQQGIVVIPRSKDPGRQKENIEVFDFALSPEEVEQLDGLNQELYVYGNPRNTISKFNLTL